MLPPSPAQASAGTCTHMPSNLCRHLNALAYFLPGLCKHLHLQAQCLPPPHLFRYLHSHGHCPVLPSEDTCTCMPTSCPGFCGHLYSHACFHHLVSAGTYSLKATAPLRPVQTFALTCPRSPSFSCWLLPFVTVPFGLCKHQHSLICMLPLFVL